MADVADRPADTGPSAGPSVGFLLSQLGFATSGGFGHRVGALGLEPRHFAVLRALRAADSQSQQAVADRLQIPPSTMVSLVDHLEKAGLLERRMHAADRRTRHLSLTSSGEDVLDKAIRLGAEWEHQICAGLSGDERDQLLGLLRRVAANVGLRQDTLPDRGTGQKPQPLEPGSTAGSGG